MDGAPAGRLEGPVPTAGIVIETVPPAVTFPLRQAVLRPHQHPEELATPLDDRPGAASFAARAPGGEVVGTATVGPDDPPPARDPAPGDFALARWRLRGMATAPAWRRRGIGSAVLDAVTAHVAAHGGGLLWCNARLTAVPFYERAGFVGHGEVFEEPAIGPHVVMWRLVAPAPRDLSPTSRAGSPGRAG